jgi:molecular chaperone GrpE (heat shock protein)
MMDLELNIPSSRKKNKMNKKPKKEKEKEKEKAAPKQLIHTKTERNTDKTQCDAKQLKQQLVRWKAEAEQMKGTEWKGKEKERAHRWYL